VGSVRGRNLLVAILSVAPSMGCSVDTPPRASEAVTRVELPLLYGSEAAKLVPSPGSGSNDYFGSAVAISGDTAVIGARGFDSPGEDSGTVYVFVRSGTTWTQQARLVPPDVNEFDGNGTSVAISGDTAVVGAAYKESGMKQVVGVAYVYVRSGTTWTMQQKLSPPDTTALDSFGARVAIDGSTIAVACPAADASGRTDAGAAYVFVRSGTTWSQQAKLVGAEALAYEGVTDVALSGETLVVGALHAVSESGAAYVFQRSGTTWSQQARLRAADATAGDGFGRAASLSGDVAVIGAPTADPGGRADAGAAYVFARSGTTWSQQAKIAASDGVAGDNFGSAAVLRGTTLVVGAHLASPAAKYQSGAAYVFAGSGTTWSQEVKLFPPDAVMQDNYGVSVALDGTSVLVGAPFAPRSTASDAGAVYSYRLVPTKSNGATCAASGECTSGFCVESVCCDVACSTGCESCRASLKSSGADGLCGPVAADTDPKDACAAGTGVCAATGACDGAGNCRSFAKAGAACGTTSCAGGVVTGKVCKGDSAECIDSSSSCAPYACGGTACRTTCAGDAECASGAHCTKSGACVANLVDGAVCTEARECGSGLCVDGVCCNVKCDGQCEACDDPASPGVCRAIAGPPHGGRTKCGAGGTTCEGVCDGVNGGACTHPIGRECSARCEAGAQVIGRCTATGGCTEDLPQSCSGYACGDGKCLRACADDTQCAARFVCRGGKCEPAPTECSPDGTSVISAGGASSSCAPYVCRAGACLGRCSSTTDCSSDTTCSASGECVPRPPRAEVDDGGGCAHARSASSAWPIALMLALLGRRRGARA